MMISLIAAMPENHVLSNQNKIPWNIPEEFELFQSLLDNSVIICGRKTFENIPEKKKNRIYIVVSKSRSSTREYHVVKSTKEALNLAKRFNKPINIVGGQRIYEETINQADQLIISWIKKEYTGDRFFPEINSEWLKTEEKEYKLFTLTKYQKRS